MPECLRGIAPWKAAQKLRPLLLEHRLDVTFELIGPNPALARPADPTAPCQLEVLMEQSPDGAFSPGQSARTCKKCGNVVVAACRSIR